jgi:nicotinamide mononucleotide transporter
VELALEIAGTVLGVAYVVLAIRENPWCWPIGIGNALLFLAVTASSRLFGQAALQAVYVVVSVYGWYEWLHGGEGKAALAVSRTPRPWLAGLAAAWVAATVGGGLVLEHRMDDPLPFVDAGTTALSLVAQWMATRKWLENWLVWMAVNLACVPMFLSQRRFAMAAFYAVLLVMAVFGYREWRRSMTAHGRGAPAT